MLKNDILTLFEANKGSYVSGQELALKFGVSRAAVWKAVKTLQNEGYRISAIPKKGYLLSRDSDIMSSQSISPFLRGEAARLRLDVRKSVTSTNSELKKIAANGEEPGLVLIANEQTAGRGRMGRSFYSPANNGIYMSLLLNPGITSDKAVLLTSLAAVSTARAIERVSGEVVGIKWVNDLYCNGKKIVGILTEGGINMETGALEYAVIGIGVNVFTSSLPVELSNIAGSLTNAEKTEKKRFNRSRLAAEILNQLTEDLPNLERKAHLPEYKARSVILGKDIYVIKNGKKLPAQALDIDENAALIIKYKNGSTETLFSDDVSIKRV